MPSVLMILMTVVFLFNQIQAPQEEPSHIPLIILKIIMFTLLIIGPIVIGRELTQAARGKRAVQPAAGEAKPAEEEAE